MRRERVGEAERGRELRAVEARAEDPERHVRARAGDRPHRLPRLRVAEERLQLEHILRERVGAVMVTAQREHRQLVGARRAAEAEVDPPGVQRRERPELLRDHERRMVREHDPARADADRARPAGDVRDHDRGRGARDAGRVVMLREPEALVAPALGVLCEVERVAQRAADTVSPSTIGARSKIDIGGSPVSGNSVTTIPPGRSGVPDIHPCQCRPRSALTGDIPKRWPRRGIGVLDAIDRVVDTAFGATSSQNEERKGRRLPMPVLAMGGAESSGEGAANTMKLVADDVRRWSSPGSATGSPNRHPSR